MIGITILLIGSVTLFILSISFMGNDLSTAIMVFGFAIAFILIAFILIAFSGNISSENKIPEDISFSDSGCMRYTQTIVPIEIYQGQLYIITSDRDVYNVDSKVINKLILYKENKVLIENEKIIGVFK